MVPGRYFRIIFVTSVVGSVLDLGPGGSVFKSPPGSSKSNEATKIYHLCKFFMILTNSMFNKMATYFFSEQNNFSQQILKAFEKCFILPGSGYRIGSILEKKPGSGSVKKVYRSETLVADPHIFYVH